MVPLLALWMPIVLAAVLVFVASSILHMALTYHRSDYRPLPNEDEVVGAMRKAGVSPGLHFFPYACDHKAMGTPEMAKKLEQGPVGMLIVMPSGPMRMGKFLGQWLGFCLLMGIFTAYVAGHTLAPGAHYLAVFRIVGTVAFMGYGMGQIVDSIWRGQPWLVTAKAVGDSLLYALLTAGAFGWLWPR